MKGYYIIFFLLLFFAPACKNEDNRSEPENNIDAARNFIRAALDGKFEDARKILLVDSVNLNYMDIAERSYRRSDQDTRNGYRAASINIHEVSEPVKDSVTIVIFSNSFMNDHDTLKLLKQQGRWLVDLKYLYEHGLDSMYQIINKDSLIKKKNG